MQRRQTKLAPLLFALVLFSGCPDPGGGGEGGGGAGGGRDNSCFDCQNKGASFLHLDSEDVAALLSIDPTTIKSSASLSTDLPALSGKSSGDEKKDSPLRGLDRITGEIRNALRCFTKETGNPFERNKKDPASCWDSVPRIVTIAQCKAQVYLVFERPFIVRTKTPDGKSLEGYSDPWSPSSPFTSQLLRSKTRMTDYKAGDQVERSNLEGVLYSLEINTWDKGRNIQFDKDCNLYVTAHVPGTSNNILIKIEPGAAENTYKEVINSNICYQRWLATPGGDVHYTGRTSSGKDCSGDSFYRMVSSKGALTEITRGWWDYAFEPQDDGTVVFYGPDPTVSGVPTWDNSCLFKFDGAKSGDEQYARLVNCITDWNRYVRQGPTTTDSTNDTERRRCSQQFYTYRGSNTPKKILSIDRDGDGIKEICTVADVEYKRAGTWRCDICVNSGSNCENKDAMIIGDTTQTDCEKTTGNKWVATNKCYNGITTNACTVTMPSGWKLNHSSCQDPGSNWSLSYSALSCIKSDKSVELLSDPAETVTRAWVVGKRLLYSTVKGGKYFLKAVSFAKDGSPTVTEVVSGVEVYEVALDPTTGKDRILLNGLRFLDNSYVFGNYDFTTKELNTNTGLTGLVDTILVVGN